MLKKHMAACLVATAFAAAPALAQTSTTSPSGATDRPAASGSGSTTTGSSAMQPGASGAASPTTGTTSNTGASSSTMGSSPAAGTSSNMAQAGGQGRFMTQIQSSQMMASSLIGTTVMGANNESIGDINDVIVDRSGQAMAVVIGVGGFLGIGEKDVAVPFSALEFNAGPATASTTGRATGSSDNVSATGSTGGSSVASNRSTATTGNTGSGDPNTNAATTSSNDGGVPDRIMLRMTKAELQAAPKFESDPRNANNASGSSTSPGTTAPKQ
jgi:sporulation protein YlmC with PRC-barrel domain